MQSSFATTESPRSQPMLQPVPPSRVLIVEDELFVAWHLESMVHDMRLNVCGMASDGENAVEQANDLDPDVVLMDIRLAGEIDGVEAARRIRSRVETPIIFVTAHGDPETLQRIEQTVPGASVLTKPVAPEQLKSAIVDALCSG